MGREGEGESEPVKLGENPRGSWADLGVGRRFEQGGLGCFSQHPPGHRHAGDKHDQGGGNRVEDSRGGEGDANDVVASRKSDIAADGPDGSPAEADRFGDGLEVLSMQFKRGRFSGKLAPASHGDADGGAGHGGGIVGPIANKENLLPRRFEFLHLG